MCDIKVWWDDNRVGPTGCEIGKNNLILWWRFPAAGSLTLHVTVLCNHICAGLCLVVVATAEQYYSIEAPDSYTAHACTGCHMLADLNNVKDCKL